jgi:hypothetical protein
MTQYIRYRHFKDLVALGDHLYKVREQYRIVTVITRDLADTTLGFTLEALIIYEQQELSGAKEPGEERNG